MKILALVVLASFAYVSEQKELVETVVQNYTPEIDELIKDQIQRELTASYIYQAYASYFQRADVSLPGIQKFFSDASLEERGHAEKLIDYVNTRGGHAQFDTLDLKTTCDAVWKASRRDGSGLHNGVEKRMCICGFVATGQINNECPRERDEWKEGLMAFEDALVTERYVNAKLLELHAAADEANDVHVSRSVM
ncbi:yolk ferritin [Elysia marginata]|uniref:Ferritin n=1 Tax=Elysia marginata TaxID=1093978 RepID=A0AAV4G6H8_9GAST|nr:yolk ferritin [Elysia marginata]